jgi:hypothetical protein
VQFLKGHQRVVQTAALVDLPQQHPLEGVEGGGWQFASPQSGKIEGIKALLRPLLARPLATVPLYLRDTRPHDHLTNLTMPLAVSVDGVLLIVTGAGVVVLLAEVLEEGGDDLVLADPLEGLQRDSGVPEKEVEELLEEICPYFVCLCVLLALSEGVYLLRQGVDLGKLDLRVLLPQLFQQIHNLT